MMQSDYYINKLSKMSDCYGEPYLTGLMEHCNVRGIVELTAEEIKKYWVAVNDTL